MAMKFLKKHLPLDLTCIAPSLPYQSKVGNLDIFAKIFLPVTALMKSFVQTPVTLSVNDFRNPLLPMPTIETKSKHGRGSSGKIFINANLYFGKTDARSG